MYLYMLFNNMNMNQVFFPITMARENYNHYYLVVYNLKTCKSYIIDNVREQSQDVIRRYGDTPKALVRFKIIASKIKKIVHQKFIIFKSEFWFEDSCYYKLHILHILMFKMN